MRVTPRFAAICALLTLTTLVLSSAPALAGGAAAGAGPDWPGFIRHGINLILFFGLIYWAARTPLKNFLGQRRAEVKDQLDSSWTAKTEAEEQYGKLEARIADFEGELEKMLTTVREDAESQRRAIEERAARSSAQLEEATKRTIEDELRRAKHALRNEAIELAVDLAGSHLKEKVDPKDQERLATTYLEQVKEGSAR